MTEEGRVLRVIATPIAPMRKAADANSGLVTEALLGERVQVEDSDDAFVKAELEEDGYVGYLPRAMLGAPGRAPSHRITVAKTFRFSGPDIKSPPLGALYLNCRVAVSDGDADDRFAQLDGGGYVLRSTMVPLGTLAADPGAVAEGLSMHLICGAASPMKASTARVSCSCRCRLAGLPRHATAI